MRRCQLISAILAGTVAPAAALKLNITAIGAKDGLSTLECWQLDAPFDVSEEPGTAGSAVAPLGKLANMSYSAIPPQYDGGYHRAPAHQWVMFFTGLAYITLPGNDTAETYVPGGEFGLIFAADTADVSEKGHRTQYPGVVQTLALSIPTADGKIPDHDTLYMGPCLAADVNGLRKMAIDGS